MIQSQLTLNASSPLTACGNSNKKLARLSAWVTLSIFFIMKCPYLYVLVPFEFCSLSAKKGTYIEELSSKGINEGNFVT